MDFYYDNKVLSKLFITSLVIELLVLSICFLCGFSSAVILAIMLFPSLFVLASAYVFCFPQRLAKIDNRSIQIDRAVPLLWCDVEQARLTYSSCFSKRWIVVFDLKPRIVYPLTFMQKICQMSRFTAFSIPIYAMRNEDRQVICEEIAKHCTLTKD